MPEACCVKSCQTKKSAHSQNYTSALQNSIQRSRDRIQKVRDLQPDALENVSNIFQRDHNSNDTEENKRSRRYNARKALNYIQSELHERSFINEHNGFYKNRICYCSNRQFDSSKPTHLYSNGKITNLFFCQMAKCPVCSGKFFEQWKNDIDTVVSKIQKNHGIVYMMTLTVPHDVKDGPEEVYDLLSAAKTKLMKHKVVKNLSPITNICRIEETYGRHGWHYHAHTLLPFDKELLDYQIEAIKDQWVKIGLSFGKSFNRDAIDIKAVKGISEAINYVCKESSFGIEEMTSTTTKEDQKKESMTMFEIIDLAAQGKWDELPYGKAKVGKLIEQWYSVKNKKTFITDYSFKKILENCKKPDEEEPVLEEVKETESRIRISSQAVHAFIATKHWSKVLLTHVRNKDLNDTVGEIWHLAEKLGIDKLEGFEDLKKHIDIERIEDVDEDEPRMKYQSLDVDLWQNLSVNYCHNSKFEKNIPGSDSTEEETEEELLKFFAPLAA